jgi:hypothetical protein
MIVNNIVIVGGGSAGWMTAAILIKSFPDKNISLIESPDIPRIGVGESTFQGINYYLEYLEIDRKDFFKYTDASIKLAIEFRNFYKNEREDSFIYPFGSPFLNETFWGLQDWQIKKSIYKNIPVSDYVDSYFPAAHLIKENTMSENKNKEFDNFDPILGTALHFDAIRFGNWLRDNYALKRGVKKIVGNVKDAKLSERGIEKIILEDGKEIVADLFVDCTGFKSILLSGYLQEDFVSYNDVLPNTHAWATRIEYKDKNKELNSVTRCTALKNGWCWNIPLWSRLGAGYVYSDKYIDHEKALNEFKEYLTKNIDMPRSFSEVEDLSFVNIKMRVGIHNRVWSKNVVAIGLSAGFIEPLESNGLFSVHEFLFELVRSLKREKVSQWDKDIFNYTVRQKFDQFVEFIRIHYSLSLRDDSQYWKDNMSRSYDINRSRLSDPEAQHLYSIQKIKTTDFNIPVSGGITWITSGMNYMLLDDVSVRLGEIANGMNYKKDLEPYFNNLDTKKGRWSLSAKNSPSLCDYLKNKYYS